MNACLAFGLTTCALISLGCTSFPAISGGECGNGVIEKPSEDCDIFVSNASLRCRPKGSLGQCLYDCTARGGVAAACPDGWGCGLDAICHEPNGTFAAPSEEVDVGAWSLAAGDFDGDGRDDIMSNEPLGFIGSTRIKFFYFDQEGKLADTRPFPVQVVSPTITNLPGDLRSDVTFSVGPVGLMQGRADRLWVPETFTSYRIPELALRVTAISHRSVEFTAPFVSILGAGDAAGPMRGTGFSVVDGITGNLEERARVPFAISDWVGDAVAGNVFEDENASPCFEPVFAERGASRFSVMDVCETDADRGTSWRKQFAITEIALSPPAAIDVAPLYADLDGNGHLDVLLGASGKTYVAYGDGKALAVAVPLQVGTGASGDSALEIPMPLAAGDVTGDGVADFVFENGLLMSSRTAAGNKITYANALPSVRDAQATSAKIADFNGDGHPDVVTASDATLNVEFFAGRGGFSFTQSLVSTAAPVKAMSVGDLDGDLLQDLALLEVKREGSPDNAVRIAYGKPFAPLDVPVTVAQVFQAQQIEAFETEGSSGLLVPSLLDVDGRPNGALTLLNASGERAPFAPFALTEFSENRSVQDWQALAVTVGSFTARDHGDLVALAFLGDPRANSSPLASQSFWLVSDLESRSAFPRRLAGELDARLEPTEVSQQSGALLSDVTSASADLDGDHRDEAIFVMPAQPERQSCALLTLSIARLGQDFVLNPHEPVFVEEPCADPVVIPIDVDGDQRTDLALLTGKSGASDRKLYILWNDGRGGFSSADRTLVSSPADSPQAFTVVPRAGGPLAIAYVTHDSLQLVGPFAKARALPAAVALLTGIEGCTGLVAADVNGDHISDLVIARSGTLQVLKAELKSQLKTP